MKEPALGRLTKGLDGGVFELRLRSQDTGLFVKDLKSR
jgi:hypothetical protein